MAKQLVITLFFFISHNVIAQGIINAYAKVTAINGTTLTLSNVNETYDSFDIGDYIYIMQMQDNVIGANTGNNASFGNLSNIMSAGRFDGLSIQSVSRSGGALSSITVESGTWLSNYHIGANTSVQIVTVPRPGGTGDYTTSFDMTCLAWNGNIGGVMAINVVGTLNLQHNINVNGKGFRGGAADNGSSDNCNSTTYRIATTDNYYADKGEGIYKNTNTNYASGRGHILSGGGGGNSHNGGGAGGGNHSAGGAGGFGWNCSPSAGGIGGIDLTSYISSWSVYMGGGGGSGEGNNNLATSGGNGGGIIIITASAISTSASCSGVTLSANGQSAANTAGNDGAGGGGAGGSIVLGVNSFTINNNCPLTVVANGGQGGAVIHQDEHGGGGGGGIGAIIYSINEPTINVSSITDPGSGGVSGGGNTNPGVVATGTPGGEDGVHDDEVTGVLPVELIKFDGRSIDNSIDLCWETASEKNNLGFQIQKSNNNEIWNDLSFQSGHGNSNIKTHYNYSDHEPFNGINYYRLKQIDYDGKFSFSNVIAVNIEKKIPVQFIIAPNPAHNIVYLKHTITEGYLINIYGLDGRLLRQITMNKDEKSFDISDLPIGIYTMIIQTPNEQIIKRLITH